MVHVGPLPSSSSATAVTPVVSVEWLTESLLSGHALPLIDFQAKPAHRGKPGAAAATCPTSGRRGGGGGAVGGGATGVPLAAAGKTASFRVGRRVYKMGEAVYVSRGKATEVILLVDVVTTDGVCLVHGRLMKRSSRGAEVSGVAESGVDAVVRHTCLARGTLRMTDETVIAPVDAVLGKCVVLEADEWADSCFGCDKEVWMLGRR